jgi:hypothetical protein
MSQRLKLVDNQEAVSIRKQCELLSVHKSSLYYAPKGESVIEIRLCILASGQ